MPHFHPRPFYDYAEANEEVAHEDMEHYFSCCGKYVCGGCIYSICKSGNDGKCAFCKAEGMGKTDEEAVEEMMRRVEANDAGAMYVLANDYYRGRRGLQQDRSKGDDLLTRAAALGSSQAHYQLGIHFDKGGVVKKAKFHFEAAAMAGHEMARYMLGITEAKSRNSDRAVKHWIIAASGGNHHML